MIDLITVTMVLVLARETVNAAFDLADDALHRYQKLEEARLEAVRSIGARRIAVARELDDLRQFEAGVADLSSRVQALWGAAVAAAVVRVLRGYVAQGTESDLCVWLIDVEYYLREMTPVSRVPSGLFAPPRLRLI